MKVRRRKRTKEAVNRNITVRLPIETYQEIEKIAALSGRTVHGSLVMILEKVTKREHKKLIQLTEAVSALLSGLVLEDTTPPQ